MLTCLVILSMTTGLSWVRSTKLGWLSSTKDGRVFSSWSRLNNFAFCLFFFPGVVIE